MLTSIALTYVGRDAHKDSISVALLRPGSTTVDEERIANTVEDVRRLVARWGDVAAVRAVLEGLLEHERVTGGSPAVRTARERGEQYLLERRMLRRLSTGEVIDPTYTQFSFPPGWHYDVLRGLDYLRAAGVKPDDRVAEGIAIVEKKRDASGRWPLEKPHEGELHFAMDEGEGKPSRWNTLNALRVLKWAGRA